MVWGSELTAFTFLYFLFFHMFFLVCGDGRMCVSCSASSAKLRRRCPDTRWVKEGTGTPAFPACHLAPLSHSLPPLVTGTPTDGSLGKGSAESRSRDPDRTVPRSRALHFYWEASVSFPEITDDERRRGRRLWGLRVSTPDPLPVWTEAGPTCGAESTAG